MKHLASLFLLSFLLCCSCSQQMDDEWKPNEQLPNVPETQPVGVSFSRASLETFAEHGITEVGVYVSTFGQLSVHSQCGAQGMGSL